MEANESRTEANPSKRKQMKIKVYLPHGYKIVRVSVADDVKKIADSFERWEYVL